jgi:hypothetical protein
MNMIPAKAYNETAITKFPATFADVNLHLLYGKPLHYNISLDAGIGTHFGMFYNKSKTSQVHLGKFGISLNYVVQITHRFFITPSIGWHHALASADFKGANNTSVLTQYNMITPGIDFSFMPWKSKPGLKPRTTNIIGISCYYQFATRPPQISSGTENFTSNTSQLNLGGLFVGISLRNLNNRKH